MRRISATLGLLAAGLWGQESKLSVTDSAWKGIEVRFVTKMEPPGENTPNRLPGLVITDFGRAHHIIQDPAHKRYFAYDLSLEPSPDCSEATLRIEPLRFSNSRPFSVGGPDWTLLAPPRYPVISNVKVGDTVALDLMVNAATGQKIVDYLTLERRDGAEPPRNPHDFSLADVELSLSQPRVNLNGKQVEATAKYVGGTSGAVVWLSLAGHGRFILSLFPNASLGFQKNGVAAADSFWFRDGSAEYHVQCDSAVAPGPGPYNLYVVHEAGWTSREPFNIGSADKAEWVVGKH
jgi:hypothetical protein